MTVVMMGHMRVIKGTTLPAVLLPRLAGSVHFHGRKSKVSMSKYTFQTDYDLLGLLPLAREVL